MQGFLKTLSKFGKPWPFISYWPNVPLKEPGKVAMTNILKTLTNHPSCLSVDMDITSLYSIHAVKAVSENFDVPRSPVTGQWHEVLTRMFSVYRE